MCEILKHVLFVQYNKNYYFIIIHPKYKTYYTKMRLGGVNFHNVPFVYQVLSFLVTVSVEERLDYARVNRYNIKANTLTVDESVIIATLSVLVD